MSWSSPVSLLRCCEKTIEVMRSSQEALVTIVQVRMWDNPHTHTHKRFSAVLKCHVLLPWTCLCMFQHKCSCFGSRVKQVLLYDPLFDWTMNPLKAFYLQHDEQQELNATLTSTMGGDDIDNHRKSRWSCRPLCLCVCVSLYKCVCVSGQLIYGHVLLIKLWWENWLSTDFLCENQWSLCSDLFFCGFYVHEFTHKF